MYGFVAYLLSLIFYLVVTILGVIYILKNKIEISSKLKRVIFLFIALFYCANLSEKLFTNEITERYLVNCCPIGNLSPFLFTCCTLSIFLPDKVIKQFEKVIVIIFPAMLIAGLSNLVSFAFSFQDDAYVCVIYDAFAHLIFFLYGFYLARNRKVDFNKKTLMFSLIFSYGIATIALIINLIFDTTFFGLNLNGKHNIYNNIITDSSILNAVIYYVGLGIILLAGYYLFKYISNKYFKKEEKESESIR